MSGHPASRRRRRQGDPVSGFKSPKWRPHSEGLKEGEERGGLRQARRAVVRALELRFEDVPNQVRERIEAVTELDRLEALLDQAIKVVSLAAFGQGLGDLANR